MAQDDSDDGRSASVWYRLGYALERARKPRPGDRLRSLAERLPLPRDDADEGMRRPPSEGDDRSSFALRTAVATGTGVVVTRLLSLWPRRHEPGVIDLGRGALYGTAAALTRRLLRPLLREDDVDADTVELLAAGAARGLLYASVVEPRLLGGPTLKGTIYGSIEYGVATWGGLVRLAGKAAPHARVPLLSGLVEGHDPADETFLDHLAFALALALLYGSAGGE